jgi:hypothetical protein
VRRKRRVEREERRKKRRENVFRVIRVIRFFFLRRCTWLHVGHFSTIPTTVEISQVDMLAHLQGC